jgi:hypothetical protein
MKKNSTGLIMFFSIAGALCSVGVGGRGPAEGGGGPVTRTRTPKKTKKKVHKKVPASQKKSVKKK